jgi:hypothetical protein
MEHVDHRHSPKATKMDHTPKRSDIDVEINRNARGSSLGPFAVRTCTSLHPPRAPKQSATNVGCKHPFSQKSRDRSHRTGPDNRNFEEIRERATRMAP